MSALDKPLFWTLTKLWPIIISIRISRVKYLCYTHTPTIGTTQLNHRVATYDRDSIYICMLSIFYVLAKCMIFIGNVQVRRQTSVLIEHIYNKTKFTIKPIYIWVNACKLYLQHIVNRQHISRLIISIVNIVHYVQLFVFC